MESVLVLKNHCSCLWEELGGDSGEDWMDIRSRRYNSKLDQFLKITEQLPG